LTKTIVCFAGVGTSVVYKAEHRIPDAIILTLPLLSTHKKAEHGNFRIAFDVISFTSKLDLFFHSDRQRMVGMFLTPFHHSQRGFTSGVNCKIKKLRSSTCRIS